MPIAKRPAKTLDEFVAAAPDGRRKGVLKGAREQITLTIEPSILAQMDELAITTGQSRAALIRRAVFELLARGSVIPKGE